MILSDYSIREGVSSGRIVIEPFRDEAVQPASYDLRLASQFRVFSNHVAKAIDIRSATSGLARLLDVPPDGSVVLHPNEFILASTDEAVGIPNDLIGRLDGKSSLARIGLIVHSTAGFVDPGFRGNLTLELVNVASLPIVLYPGELIAQISFLEMTTPATRPYGHPTLGSKYQGQSGPTERRHDER